MKDDTLDQGDNVAVGLFADVPMAEPVRAGEEGAEEEDTFEDSTDSEEEERSICRSPSKSPRKLSSVLKRKREQSDNSEEVEEAGSEEEIVGEAATVSVGVKRAPTDEDFQFKEPKFRKKKFIFHPFCKNREGVFAPAPASPAVEVITSPGFVHLDLFFQSGPSLICLSPRLG